MHFLVFLSLSQRVVVLLELENQLVQLRNLEFKALVVVALVVGEVVDYLGAFHQLGYLPNLVIAHKVLHIRILAVSIDFRQIGWHHVIDDTGAEVARQEGGRNIEIIDKGAGNGFAQPKVVGGAHDRLGARSNHLLCNALFLQLDLIFGEYLLVCLGVESELGVYFGGRSAGQSYVLSQRWVLRAADQQVNGVVERFQERVRHFDDSCRNNVLLILLEHSSLLMSCDLDFFKVGLSCPLPQDALMFAAWAAHLVPESRVVLRLCWNREGCIILCLEVKLFNRVIWLQVIKVSRWVSLYLLQE